MYQHSPGRSHFAVQPDGRRAPPRGVPSQGFKGLYVCLCRIGASNCVIVGIIEQIAPPRSSRYGPRTTSARLCTPFEQNRATTVTLVPSPMQIWHVRRHLFAHLTSSRPTLVAPPPQLGLPTPQLRSSAEALGRTITFNLYYPHKLNTTLQLSPHSKSKSAPAAPVPPLATLCKCARVIHALTSQPFIHRTSVLC